MQTGKTTSAIKPSPPLREMLPPTPPQDTLAGRTMMPLRGRVFPEEGNMFGIEGSRRQQRCAQVAWVALAVMLWTGLVNFTDFPAKFFPGLGGLLPKQPLASWRLMNFLFLAACFPFYKYAWRLKEIRILMSMHAMLVGGLCLRALVVRTNLMLEFSQAFAVLTALAVAPAVAGLWYYNQRKTMRAVSVSMFICIGYQAFQLVTYYATGRGEFWPTIFIDTAGFAVGSVNFFRVVGGFYGASGFMHESGHLALFVGPQLLLLLIVWHYRRLQSQRVFLQIAVCVWSLIMTLAMGGFLQVAIVAITFCLLAENSVGMMTRTVRVLAVTLITGVIVYVISPVFFNAIIGHVIVRTGETAEGESLRQLYGSEYLWEMFWASPQTIFWGRGLGVTLDELGANPNVLIALTYVTHGGVLATLMFASYIISMLRLAFVYRKALFIIPILAIGIHLMMAYGTYRWPSFWVTIALSICYASTFGMRALQTPIPQKPSNPQDEQGAYAQAPQPPPKPQPPPPLQRPSLRGKPGALTPARKNAP